MRDVCALSLGLGGIVFKGLDLAGLNIELFDLQFRFFELLLAVFQEV